MIDKFTSMHAENEDLIFLKAPIYRLGGYGVEKDEKKAFEIWKYISEKYKEKINGAGAACQLSLYYRDGIGTKKDIQKAEELLKTFKEKNPKGECSHKAFDFLFEPSGLEKELLNTEE